VNSNLMRKLAMSPYRSKYSAGLRCCGINVPRMEAKVIKIKRKIASLTELKKLKNDFIGSCLYQR
jgi:hypothetical protein